MNFLWGEALIFFFPRDACLTKYRLLNPVFDKLQQKLLGLWFPGKRAEAAFNWDRLACTGISRDSVPPPIVCSPFSLLCQVWTDSTTGVVRGEMVYVQSFYLKDHHVSTSFANVGVTRMPWKALICMLTVAAVHKYVRNFDHWYWNGDPECKLGCFKICWISVKWEPSKYCILKL